MSKHRLLFAKTGRARYISHLDLMRTFQRAFLRADIAIKHTEGFNKHAFVSIPLPLSVGFSSQCELLDFELVDDTPLEQVPQRMNKVLPEGVEILSCYEAGRPAKHLAFVEYEITIPTPSPKTVAEELTRLLSQESWTVTKASQKAKSGFTTLDIIPLVKWFNFTVKDGVLVLHALLSAQNPGLNPQVLLRAAASCVTGINTDRATYHRVNITDQAGKEFR